MNKYILITGVAGLLGANLADWIIENKPEYTVVGIDSLFGGYIENVNQHVIFHKMDLSTCDLKPLFEQYKFDYVFHFAAYAAAGLSPFIRKYNYLNNIQSTVNIINECVNYNVKRLIYTSSMCVYGYGDKHHNRFDESDICQPIDPYGISKYACELDIQSACEQFGLDYCIIRPHNIYGEKQNIWDKYRNVLGIWMKNILYDEPILIYGDGEQTRAFTYVKDILEPIWNAAVYDKASQQIINLGGIETCTINESASILSDITGYDNIEYREARHEVKWAVPTYQKSIDILNFKNKTDLKEGLNNMWKWAQKQPKREQYKWEQYEISKNIYSYWK